MLLGDLFLSKDALGQGEAWKCPIRGRIAFFFSLFLSTKEIHEGWGGAADPQYLGCLTSLCIGCWSIGSSSLSSYPKKAPQRRTLCRFARQPSQTILLLCPMEFASFPPPSSFFFSSFPFKSQPGKPSDVGADAVSSSGLLGEGSGGDIPGHITEIWLQAGLPSAAHDHPLLGTGGKDGQGAAFGWGGSFSPQC